MDETVTGEINRTYWRLADAIAGWECAAPDNRTAETRLLARAATEHLAALESVERIQPRG